MPRRLALPLAFVALGAFPALAQTTVPETQAEADRLFADADRELNAVYQRCVAPESNTVQAINALRAAQRDWIGVRDGTARAYQLGETGRKPLDDQYYAHARTVLTWSRTDELKTLFGCE